MMKRLTKYELGMLSVFIFVTLMLLGVNVFLANRDRVQIKVVGADLDDTQVETLAGQ